MKILHTSDWHLGRELYSKPRYNEFKAWLNWLKAILKEQEIDVLLIAGDIFDTSNPPNEARKLYFEFLADVCKQTLCRHVFITSGNHDSGAMLDAPSAILDTLDIHIIGRIRGNPQDEVFIVKDEVGMPQAVVCAVPFLSDRDIRLAQPGEPQDQKIQKTLDGIINHYRQAADIAERCRAEYDIPVIAMGHLYIHGGALSDRDNPTERLIIGNLDGIRHDMFPNTIDYFALGHLHVAQMIANNPFFRYSGSPIALDFGEMNKPKEICIIEFYGRVPKVSAIPIPIFQKLVSIEGTLQEIMSQIDALPHNESIWIQVIYQGREVIPSLSDSIKEAVKTHPNVECLRIINETVRQQYLQCESSAIELKELTVEDVFERFMKQAGIDGKEYDSLKTAYMEIVAEVQGEDNEDH